jgi:nicotinamide-nucleotide amidase
VSDPGRGAPSPPLGVSFPLRAAVLVSVGTELSEGVILNTHFRFLGSALKSLGISVLKGVQVPDEAAIFEGELCRALEQGDLVIVTGGLGPTSDDLTRQVAARAAGVALEFRPELWDALLRRYGDPSPGRRPLAAANRRQAHIPAGFAALENRYGTAPGFVGEVRGSLLAALPGPPSELEPMFAEQLIPHLLSGGAHSRSPEQELVGTVLLTPESVLEDTLQRLSREIPGAAGVLWGTRVAEDRIVLTLRSGTARNREALFEALALGLGELLVRRGEARPVERLFGLLLEQGLTIAFAESCTGGLLSKLLTDLPGSSRVFWGSVVSYDNGAKRRLLAVDSALLERFGAVSKQAAAAMSEGILSLSGTQLGLAVTGIAGPDGGTQEKPAGTVWISGRTAGAPAASGRTASGHPVSLHPASGPAAAGREICIGFQFRGSRDMVRRRSAVAAFLVAECLVEGRDPAALERLPG